LLTPTSVNDSVAANSDSPARHFGRLRFSAVELLIALLILFVTTPFVEGVRHGTAIEAVLVTLVLLSAVLAVGVRRRTLLFAALLAAPAVLGKWLHHFRPDLVAQPVFLVMALAFLGFVICHLLSFVLRARRVNYEVLCASISAYLMIGLLWAYLYVLVGLLNPQAFAFTLPQSMDGFNAFYFSLVTLSTVGYGDITPVSRVARMLSAMEAMTGLLYMSTLVARLVALYSRPDVPDNSTPSPKL
jgi:hypothetical protein